MAAAFINVKSAELSVSNGAIRTVDNHKDIEKILAIAFTINRAVNHLNAGRASLKNRLTWYRIISIVRTGSRLAFCSCSGPIDLEYSRSD